MATVFFINLITPLALKFKSVSIEMSEVVQKKPKWLRVKLPTGKTISMCASLYRNTNYTPFVKAETALIWVNAGVREPQLL